MRIKQNKLGKPDYEYITVLKGNNVIVRIYHEPQYCVMVETPKDKQVYPLTFEQYNNYCDNAIIQLHFPNKEVVSKMLRHALKNAEQCKHDRNLLRFWLNVADCYKRKIQEA